MSGTMEIRKCLEEDISRVGLFYDETIVWLNDHVNYPRWIYRVYPSEESVRKMTETGSQYICVCGDAVIGAFALDAEPQGLFQKGMWRQDLVDGSYMVLHALAVDPSLQREGTGSHMPATLIWSCLSEISRRSACMSIISGITCKT